MVEFLNYAQLVIGPAGSGKVKLIRKINISNNLKYSRIK